MFENSCPVKAGGCHDGALIEHLVKDGWSFSRHPIDICAMYHNDNPKSCEMVGGYWFDTIDRGKAGCYYMQRPPNFFPKPLSDINYDAYLTSQTACIC